MALGIKLIPLDGINIDLANAYLKPTQARFIKNLYYQLTDGAEAITTENSEKGKLKPLQSNEVYAPFDMPAGDNWVIGIYPSRETNELYVCVYNSLTNHFIFRINGGLQTVDVSAPNPCYNFQLSPEFFIGEGQCYLDVNTFVDADSALEVIKKDFYWTDGKNYQGFIRFDDYLNTNGFDPALYPYFVGDYDRCSLVRVGLPTPKDCVTYTEVQNTEADAGLNNNLLFQGTQLRITAIDVFGRPSEHGIISDLYLPGVNDCFSASSELPRCLDLSIFVGNPLWDKIAVEFSNDNELQWYTDTVINLYDGSALGKWWLRSRNPDVIYDSVTERITYRYCRNKECNPIDPAETNKTQPSLAKRSQAVGKVGQRIGFANNKYNFNPFPSSVLDKISLNITQPVGNNELRDITVYVCINTGKGVKKFQDQYFFGGNDNDTTFAAAYKQVFPQSQRGWIGYLNDGSYVISTQWVYSTQLHTLIEDVDYKFGYYGGGINPFVFQKFVFRGKPKGSYIFRLADHECDLKLNPYYDKTSTTVYGLCPFNTSTLQPYQNRTALTGKISQELLIDVCDSDYDTLNDFKILVIQDISDTSSSGAPIFSTKGSFYEDADRTIPVELMNVEDSFFVFSSIITDHNGYYWYMATGDTDVTFNVTNKCGFFSFAIGSDDYIGTRIYNKSLNSQAGILDYDIVPCNRVLIKGRIVLKEVGIGVPNVLVTLTRSRGVFTDANGYFTLVAHDEYALNVRNDFLVFGSPCGYSSEDCNCIIPISVFFQMCTVCFPAPQSPPASPPDPDEGKRVINIVPDFVFCYDVVNKGLVSSGTYGWAVTGYDWLGRHTFIQDKGYFTVPSIIQNKIIAPHVIDITIDPSTIFPPEIEYIVFSITAETTMENYLDWIVDNVLFIDNRGTENTISPTQIKIYYKSIIEYNKQHGYNTTDGWQFIPTGSTTPATGDTVQFFINGDGTYFTKSLTSLIKYDANGEYFLIDYTTDLKDLKANAYMRLISPKVCTGNEPYYEICSSKIDLVDHKSPITTFRLNAFDTYYLPRQIPVPVLVPPVPPATEPTFVNELRIPGNNFEHHSPSNFWGYRVWNRGRLNVKNPYEAEILRPNETQLSGTLSPNGQLTYLQNFDENFKHNFDINDQSGITYFRVKSGIICFITGYNNFIVGYNDNLARLVNGNLQVPSGDGTFGKPERRTNGDYGCTLFDKNTIREREGLIHFLDSSRVAVLQHNFSDCMDVSNNEKTGSSILSWLIKKIKYIQEYNRNNASKKYFHGVINPANFEYILSDFTVNSNEYVNEERDYDITKHESFAFDMYGKVWKAMYASTPEYWGFLEGEKNGQQLFSFKNCVPYYYYNSANPTFGTIFGVVVERVYEFIITSEVMKKEKPVWMEVYCKESGYFCDRIVTEAGQVSRILIAHFNQGEFMWRGHFLRNTDTPLDPNLPDLTPAKTILEGNPLYGEWVKIRMIGYPDANTIYSQLSGIQVYINTEDNTGLKQP